MTKSDFYSAPGSVIRKVAVANYAVIPFMCLIFGRMLTLPLMTYGILISSSVILMIPRTYNDSKFSVWTAFVTLSLSLVVSLWDCASYYVDGDMSCGRLLYPLLTTVPLAVLATVRSFRMMRDIKYLTMKTSGWEMMLCTIDYAYLAFLMIITSVMSSVSAGMVWGRILVFALSLLLFSILFIRSITGGPIITYNSSGVPSGEKNVEICAYVPEAHRSDTKVMYDKMCELLKSNQSFLDADYRIEDLAREMFSNRVYVSKLINAFTGMSFSQLMNRYRVEYSKELFKADVSLKVKDLADMSGFHTQVTYIAAFKVVYGTTPGGWCKEYLDSIKDPSNSGEQEQ